MKPIGKQIRQRRETEGITQVQLAARASVSKNIVSMIERDKAHNPTLGSLQAIADALDCDLVVKLKPRKAAADEPQYGPDMVVDWRVTIPCPHCMPEATPKIDPQDAAFKAKIHEIVAKIQALPWDLIPDAEYKRRIVQALAEQGDEIAAEAYLDALLRETESIGIIRQEDGTITVANA